MKFWKLHGIGNDFVAIDGRYDNIDNNDYGDYARRACHRQFSVGADGLLVVKNSDIADIEMVYYNSDGSRAAMCGNGLRCFVKFVYDNKIIEKDEFDVYTLDGIKRVKLNLKDNEIQTIKVNMGKGSFLAKDVPVNTEIDKFIEQKINVLDREYTVSSILMGVPHTIVFVDELNMDEVCKYGAEIENHEMFPQKTNVNFVQIIDDKNILVKTFERGCGYTFGCGTGMTASVMVSNYLGKVGKSVNVTSEGGSVQIDLEYGFAYMTGTAVKICEGNLEV